MQLQVMFIMKYPQDWFHYLGKRCACALALWLWSASPSETARS